MERMKVKGQSMDDLLAEMYGAADIVAFMAMPFLNEECVAASGVVGSALYGIGCYIRRIADDIGELDAKQGEGV